MIFAPISYKSWKLTTKMYSKITNFEDIHAQEAKRLHDDFQVALSGTKDEGQYEFCCDNGVCDKAKSFYQFMYEHQYLGKGK